MSDIVIRVEHLSKMYRLGIINNGTLFRDLQTWWALKRGKEDPHSTIGENRYAGDDDHFWALKNLDFEIKRGDRIGIIGKNGAGKSTLLKILSRVTAPTEGVVKVKGKIASLLEVGTGFHGELTGRENIFLNGAILGMKRAEVAQKLDEIIAFSGIDHHIDTPVKRYSSGMYVRLAFAVAAHLDSEILIADEVLAVGDAEFQKKALGKMRDLSTGQGRTVLFVSHNMSAVKNLCNRGIVMDAGRIVEYSDDISNAVNHYLYDQTKMTESRASWENDGSLNNRYFKPIKYRIAKDDSPIPEFTASDSLTIHLEFYCEEISPNLSFEFYVYATDTNAMVFSASPFYSIEDYKPSIGSNRVSCALPTNFFNDKQYRLELQAGLFCQEWILEPEKTAPNLFFVINKKINHNPFSRPSWEATAPYIEWKLVE